MTQTSDYMTTERCQSFFGGLVTTVKINNPYKECSTKDFKLFGHSLAKRIEENNFKSYYFLGKKVCSFSLLKEFKHKYFGYFDPKYDDIYILNANSGETFLVLAYLIRALIKKNGSKNPLLVATYKYHTDIINMVCPDIPHIYIENYNRKITESTFTIDNFRFFQLFPPPYFMQVEMDIKKSVPGEYHYFDAILKHLGMNRDEIEKTEIVVPEDVEKSMLEKVKQTGLNLEKFVFLAPEAQSCKLYDEDFWVLLINKFQEKGYDVYVNLTGNEVKLRGAVDYKTTDLTFSQAFALAKRAKKIVSLRSGLTEFLVQTGVPLDVLYTKFRYRHYFDDMDIYHAMGGYGLLKLPFVDKSKVHIFNMFEVSQKDCLDKVLENS